MNRATSILSARAFWSDDIVEQPVSSVISVFVFTLSLMESVGDDGLVKVGRTTFESSHQSSIKDLGRHFRITGISASAEQELVPCRYVLFKLPEDHEEPVFHPIWPTWIRLILTKRSVSSAFAEEATLFNYSLPFENFARPIHGIQFRI